MTVVWLRLLYCYGGHRDLHSFPTRRSSDLLAAFGFARYLARPLRELNSAAERAGRGESPPPLPESGRSEEHTSEIQSHHDLVCRRLPEKKKATKNSMLSRITSIGGVDQTST